MNAKKIMGAVLVALLAAALFIGAGAATPASGTVFVNQALPSDYNVAWVGSNGVVTPFFDGTNYYFPAGTEGVYTYEISSTKYTITVKAPELFATGIAGSGDAEYQFINGVYYIDTGVTNLDAKVLALLIDASNVKIYLTTPNGEEVEKTANDIKNYLNADPAVGTHSIRAVINATEFAKGTLYNDRITAPVSFKVAEAGEGTITASVDQAIKGGNFKVTITGQPGLQYKVNFESGYFKVAANQIGLPGITEEKSAAFEFTMPNTGSVEFVMTSVANKVGDSEKIELLAQKDDGSFTDKQGSVTIKFAKGTITAAAEKASYFVGDKITITGTSTAGPIVGYTIKGTNFEKAVTTTIALDSNKAFEFDIETANLKDDKNKKLDVGTYTITLDTGSAKATVAVVLKQPFISIVEAPEVIVQDTEAKFIVNAEATTAGIKYYIFGTNYFLTGTETVADDDVETQYTVTLNEDTTDNMSAGQYFAVFQHPMYDGAYNITGNNDTWMITGNGNEIDVKERQTANAAQALCDALDAQNIDDMYVKYSFFVVGEDESFTISEIPASIAQGETLTISGTSTAAAGEYVTVEMISTAFAAVPKETVGSAAFIAVTTQIADDGTWEVTFDTSNLNVDEYSLQVACTGQEKPWKNVNINVVEAGDEPVTPEQPEEPEQPEQPEEPVAPATPGFGALAALAGLGAVAVLLLRRE